ncbi:CRISPR-associated protein [Corynebacterium yudongzhengii]|uniref:Type I-E CRISPR-associated protein Cse1/CasA n=1 Tax=Corynebacterium yudongzhengii TaxID=2080740 RepID=A0A2U1T433_9CORY|nr:type I-E CRISPR-associated protein Cse1/CasA [Corynebacterium yudongzhengii]AWB82409.1 CRISPR-associated protein [Corynebacterium yudongzhengii]PWC00743.1 type I-E CRISPR-associated protein Cse1/CasA [Corynebacterium yudongzhengii]
MTLNALTDIAFLKTTDGRSDVRGFLRDSHLQGTQLDMKEPGYTVSAQIRLLSAVAAVAMRHSSRTPEELRTEGFEEGALDAAIDDLAPGCDPFSATIPFMQRPALKPGGPKDTARQLGPGQQPVKKLSPSMLPDQGESYWNLLAEDSTSLSLPDALLSLVVFHHMSMAGNNAYDGDKCQMGSPAMRFVGVDLTATEMFFHGPTMMDTFLYAISQSWIEGEGLPAWADRTAEHSITEIDGVPQAHPLWAATWSSNAPACCWDENRLVGVRTGGIPEAWYLNSEMGTTKQSRKDWWDVRNTLDPFYLYIRNDSGELKVQRLDMGRDGTELAVEWASENKMEQMINALIHRCVEQPDDEAGVVFIRHQIGGSASSPNIRASEVFSPSPDEWAFDLDEDLLTEIRMEAGMIRQLHDAVCNPFRRKPSNSKYPPAVLDDLVDRRSDASSAFWRKISQVYRSMLADIRQRHSRDESIGYELPDSLKDQCVAASLAAFDEVVNPHSLQEPANIAFVRGVLERRLRKITNSNTAKEESY